VEVLPSTGFLHKGDWKEGRTRRGVREEEPWKVGTGKTGTSTYR